MKLLLVPLLLLGSGLGGYSLLGGNPELPEASASDCRVSVECTEAGTCLVTCFDADGGIQCQKEVQCDEPCETSGQSSTPATTPTASCDAPCAVPSSCSPR